jgi:hypothetical protein
MEDDFFMPDDYWVSTTSTRRSLKKLASEPLVTGGLDPDIGVVDVPDTSASAETDITPDEDTVISIIADAIRRHQQLGPDVSNPSMYCACGTSWAPAVAWVNTKQFTRHQAEMIMRKLKQVYS